MGADVLLCTLNSRFIHCAFGLRYIYANLDELQSRTRILEFTISQDPRRIAEEILAHSPRIVGFGVYIWNTRQTEDVIAVLKSLSPDLTIVLGGPEVRFESESQSICQKADFVIKGEGDFAFKELCNELLIEKKPTQKLIQAELPNIHQIELPYAYYSDSDIKNRVIYVEASRGCPYKCEYCLSSLDTKVRNFELEPFLAEMQKLIDRGARQFKFVDRTFNLSISFSTEILRFFLKQIELGLFLHFEMVPDRLPHELKELITKFPKGSLQFEIGIQTFDQAVSKNISRKNDLEKVRENFKFLRNETGVHTHADLIVGLPGETLETFGRGFDMLLELDPDEIQVGILKRLKGTPIIRHDAEFQMKYQSFSPFQVLSTSTMSFSEIQTMVLFAKFWDLTANSGNFKTTIQYLKTQVKNSNEPSFFKLFMSLTLFLKNRHAESHSIALPSLVESMWVFMTQELFIPADTARALLIQDYCETVKRDVPQFLRNSAQPQTKSAQKSRLNATPKRQKRHLIEGVTP